MPPTTKSFVAAGVLALGLSTTPAIATGPAHADTSTTSTTSTSTSTSTTTESRPRNGYGVRLTTFNILSSAMARGGIDRATRAARWVQGEGATVAAFQEVAKDQLRQMQKSMPGYNFFPRRTLGTRGSAIQIAFKTSEVKVMETGHVMRPFLGWQRPIPYMRFRDRETGRGFRHGVSGRSVSVPSVPISSRPWGKALDVRLRSNVMTPPAASGVGPAGRICVVASIRPAMKLDPHRPGCTAISARCRECLRR